MNYRIFVLIFLLLFSIYAPSSFAKSVPEISKQSAPCWVAADLLWNELMNGKPDGAKAEGINSDVDRIMAKSPDCLLAIYTDEQTPDEVKNFILNRTKEMLSCKTHNWCGTGMESDDNCAPGKEINYCPLYPKFYKRLQAINAE